MPRKFKFCFQCRRTITESEVWRGLFVQTPNGMLCAACAQQLDEETEAAKKLAAGRDPAPAEPPAPAVEEKPAPVPPAEPPKEEPAPESPSIPHSALRTPHSEAPAGTPLADSQSGGSEPPVQLLDGIRQHLEAIHRTLVFEKSSPWNVLATVAQCLAIGMLILAAVNWADNPMQLLLVALVFQVMALTFFVRGK
jgi:hypothetical protein